MAGFLLLQTLLVIGQPGTALASSSFGSSCQADFENDWLDPLTYAWDTCSYFNAELDATDYFAYYYNNVGAKQFYESTNDQARLETVGLAFQMTHGSVTSTAARWSMWNSNTRAMSNQMRLGDESVGTSILANIACHQLENGQNNEIYTRWNTVFKGGLRITTGSHGTLWDGFLLDENGEDFADELQSGASVKIAWRDGLYDWWEDQDIAVLSMSSNTDDCVNRKNNLTWSNFHTFPQKRDGNVTHWCRSFWTDY